MDQRKPQRHWHQFLTAIIQKNMGMELRPRRSDKRVVVMCCGRFCYGLLCLWLLASETTSLSSIKPNVKDLRNRSILRKVDRLLTRLQNPSEQFANYTYLRDNYAPVYQEQSNVDVGDPVYGKCPNLNGLLIRNGPNPTEFLSRRYHWFDGHAMLHMLRFSDRSVTYSNSYVPNERYIIEKELEEDIFPGIGDYSGFWGFLKLLFHVPMVQPFIHNPPLNAAPPNTSCLMYRNKLYCLNEGRLPFEVRINPDDMTLHPIGSETFDGRLNYPVSAHPKIDQDGDLIFHSYTVDPEILGRDGPLKLGRYVARNDILDMYFAPLEDQGASSTSFVHNILFTHDYIVTYQCSVEFDPQAMFEGGSFFRTKPEKTLRYGIVPKGGKKDDIKWVDTNRPGSIVHPLNSWQDEEGMIVIWTPLCEHLVVDLENDDLNEFRMVEHRLDPSTGSFVSERFIDNTVNVEFSVAAVQGQFTKFGYTAIQDASTPGEGTFAGFCIWDMGDERLHKTLYYNEGEVGGEPMLVASDDGEVYVGIYQQDLASNDSFFCLYDGVTADLIARWKLPYRVPYGFHGTWISENELEAHVKYHKFIDDAACFNS